MQPKTSLIKLHTKIDTKNYERGSEPPFPLSNFFFARDAAVKQVTIHKIILSQHESKTQVE